MVITQPQTKGTFSNRLRAMADPMTYEMGQSRLNISLLHGTYFSNVSGDDGTLSKNIQGDIQPPWEMGSTVFG